MSSDSIQFFGSPSKSPRGNPWQDHLDDGAPARRGSQLAPEPPQLRGPELAGEAALPSGLQGPHGLMPRAFNFLGLFISHGRHRGWGRSTLIDD